MLQQLLLITVGGFYAGIIGEDVFMEEKVIPLHLLPTGSFGRVKESRLLGSTRRRLLDLGLINGTVVESLRRSPFGDPTAYQIRGAVIALRQEEASHIYVERI